MTDDELRQECEQWLGEQGLLEYNEYTQEPLNNTGLMDALLRLCRSREAETWRAVVQQCREGFILPATAGVDMGARALGWEQLNIIIAWCEAKAKELEMTPDQEDAR